MTRLGMVIDLKLLSGLLDAVIMERYDHRCLHLDVPELAGLIPTTENLVLDIWRQLAPRLEALRETFAQLPRPSNLHCWLLNRRI